MGEDEGGAGDVADLAGAGGDVAEGAPPAGEQGEPPIRKHLPSIHATMDHGLSNGLIESVNTKIRVLTRISYGFHNAAALIALAMLALGGLRPPLPGR